jgi:hypothetical protein
MSKNGEEKSKGDKERIRWPDPQEDKMKKKIKISGVSTKSLLKLKMLLICIPAFI